LSDVLLVPDFLCFSCQMFYFSNNLVDVFKNKTSGTRVQILCQMFENRLQTFEFSKHLVHQDKTSGKILDIGKHIRTSWKRRGQGV
jgi:hypothetical protein